MRSGRPVTVVVAVGAMLAGMLSLVAPAYADEVTPEPTPVTFPDPVIPVCATTGRAPTAQNRNAPANSPMGAGQFFSFPNRSSAERYAIRNRVLNTIKSTNGCYYRQRGTKVVTGSDGTSTKTIPVYSTHHGVIRIATWSYNDWGIQNALRAAKARGVAVQVLAARSINVSEKYQPWVRGGTGARSAFGYRAKVPGSLLNNTRSWATDCSGACRGRGGTPHSKYFLFNDVGRAHIGNITMSTSMNLTRFAYVGQWNQATVWRNNAVVQNRLKNVFFQSAAKTRRGFTAYRGGGADQFFFPGGNRYNDPVLKALKRVSCAGGTRVRVIQYSMYATRGNLIAKRLRYLWNKGCNVRIIYSITSRPVLKILRSRAGRGKVPMKQSVIKNRRGEIVKYNHSKWVAINGRYAGKRGQWTVLAGSSNWSDFAYRCDEQMQQVSGYRNVRPYFANFDKTWRQKTSRRPAYGRLAAGARTLDAIPPQPTFGRGMYRYLDAEEG